MSGKTKVPEDLGDAGAALYRRVVADLDDGLIFDQLELERLHGACRDTCRLMWSSRWIRWSRKPSTGRPWYLAGEKSCVPQNFLLHGVSSAEQDEIIEVLRMRASEGIRAVFLPDASETGSA